MSKHDAIDQAKFVVVASLIFILLITLFPFRFTSHIDPNLISVRHLVSGLVELNGWQEPLMNILLFVPFGFGVAGLIAHWHKRPFPTFLLIFGAGLALSALIESVQIFIFIRTTSVVDLLTNSMGAGCGFLLFYFYGEPILESVDAARRFFSRLSVMQMIILSIVYMLGVAWFWQSWRQPVSLVNWEPTFPLLIGNEKTGDRAWEGAVSQLYFTDFVLSTQEIEAAFEQGEPTRDGMLALYQPEGEADSFSDQLGYLPDLIRQEQSSSAWLLASGVGLLNVRLKTTSQFTIGVVVQTAVISQTGPARIISISANPSERNFMLGQEGDDLVIRLRTPATGLNGSDPKFLLPNLFADTRPHHIIVTYDGQLVQIYVDGGKRPFAFDLTEVAMAQRLFFVAYTDPVTLPAKQTGFFLFKYSLFIMFPLLLFWSRQKW